MKQKELSELFCGKLYLEYQRFKEEQLKLQPEAIFGNAYLIDSIISILEQLLEMSQQLSEQVLEKLILFPELLTFLYERWLGREDSHEAEMAECLKEEIAILEKEGGKSI